MTGAAIVCFDPFMSALAVEPGILENLGSADRALFLSRCTRQTYRKGEFLCSQGGLHAENFLMIEGLARTFYVSPGGREITLGYWSSGNLLGGPNFFEVCPHIWSVEAARDSAAHVIKAKDFRELTLEVPSIADCVMRTLSFKMHWFSLLCQMLGTESAGSRVARLLLMLAPLYGDSRPDGVALRVNFTHAEIGNMVGATRPWVSQALANLQKMRAIRIEPTHHIVLDVPALERLLETTPARSKPGAA